MSWRTHVATGRDHAFHRSPRVSDCGLACFADCGQTVMLEAGRDVVVRTVAGQVVVRVPAGACGLCVRVARRRARDALKSEASP